MEMDKKRLGNTPIMLSEIGLGTAQYSGGPEALRQGIELGANVIDTAEIYGTEKVVSQAVQGIREQVFIVTKVSGDNLGYDEVMRAAQGSLSRLATDYIDLYLVHWPDPSAPISETMRAMTRLADEGWIRHIGVSNFSGAQLKAARQASGEYPIMCNQVKYSLRRREIEKELLPYCEEQGILIMAHTPLNGGELAYKPDGASDEALRTLEEVANEAGKTMAQVSLNWCTAQPNVMAIPKSNSLSRIKENLDASGWRLTSEQIRRLSEAFGGVIP